MAAANYHRPKPADQIGRRRDCVLRARCAGCLYFAEARVGDIQAAYRLPDTMRLYELIDRLRCHQCGAKPSDAEVVGR